MKIKMVDDKILLKGFKRKTRRVQEDQWQCGYKGLGVIKENYMLLEAKQKRKIFEICKQGSQEQDGTLSWFGHISRITNEITTKNVHKYNPISMWAKGRPEIRKEDIVTGCKIMWRYKTPQDVNRTVKYAWKM